MPRRDLSKPLAASTFDQNDPKKKKSTGATTTSPISAGAKADIKKTFTTSADKAKEKDFAQRSGGKGYKGKGTVTKNGRQGVAGKFALEGRTKQEQEAYIDAKYKRKRKGKQTSQDEGTSYLYKKDKEKFEKELKAAKTPKEKQRVYNKYTTQKTQNLDKQARTYK